MKGNWVCGIYARLCSRTILQLPLGSSNILVVLLVLLSICQRTPSHGSPLGDVPSAEKNPNPTLCQLSKITYNLSAMNQRKWLHKISLHDFSKAKNKEIKNNTAFALKAANYFIQQSVQHMLSDFWKKYLGWVQPYGELGMKASGQQPFRKILWSKYIKKHFYHLLLHVLFELCWWVLYQGLLQPASIEDSWPENFFFIFLNFPGTVVYFPFRQCYRGSWEMALTLTAWCIKFMVKPIKKTNQATPPSPHFVNFLHS